MLLNANAKAKPVAVSRAGLFVVALTSIFLFTYSCADLFLPSDLIRVHFEGRFGAWRSSSLLERQRILSAQLVPLLEEYKPNCSPPIRASGAAAVHFSLKSDSVRPDVAKMPDTDVEKMHIAHTGFVREVLQKHKDGAFGQVFVKGTKGIVSTAGGKYMPVFVSSLRMLRRTGSNLPVEVFMKDASEYEANICDVLLPSMNAKCLILDDILNPKTELSADSEEHNRQNRRVEIAHFQLKVFATLFSSFEEILWIDADCFPLHRPEPLFDSEPFINNGMVLWPDYWASTASPLYYAIVNKLAPPINERASSETGQFMISKRSHKVTLLLSAYYNFWGPSHYFTLLSQGGPGEGDKETFLAAAFAAGESFHTVTFSVRPLGHPVNGSPGAVSGSAMAQANPLEDYNKDSRREPSIFFIHANYPKFDPATVFDKDFRTAPTWMNGAESRAWTYPDNQLTRLGYDVEKAYWEEIMWVACSAETDFAAWTDKLAICERVKDYWAKVFEDPTAEIPDFGAEKSAV